MGTKERELKDSPIEQETNAFRTIIEFGMIESGGSKSNVYPDQD